MSVDPVAARPGTPALLQVSPDRPLLISRQSGPAPQADGSEGGFAAVLDIFNPLQHIPVVGDLYRSATNDGISEDARQAGRALYGFLLGGPVGLGAAMMANHFLASVDVKQPVDEPAGPPPGSGASGAGSEHRGSRPADTAASGPASGHAPGFAPFLGEKTAAATVDGPSQPLDLMKLFDLKPGTEAGTASGLRVADPGHAGPVPKPELEVERGVNATGAENADAKPEVSDAEKVSAIAAHSANHLPIEVLKTLQDRHAAKRSLDAT
ncbi:hypothetical protein GCM10011316_27170 [Roseibium aquae]|uniref:Uncharacterized protein n=1 Tax=Roseibium aquae TaxID=1323746 RepID=A0A916TKT0_9HYPH|nr:hypothetical protein [Roseibium aquae]GGB53713.1 hypothetical protein GCM10011316_27170 [Roseibium aquae]